MSLARATHLGKTLSQNKEGKRAGDIAQRKGPGFQPSPEGIHTL